MPRGLGLRELQDALQIADTHLTIIHDQVEDAKAGGVRAGEENLRSQVNVKMFQPHTVDGIFFRSKKF